ncbi:MAG: dienelactone hydrolase family protein [Pseudobdellovibrio sp.]
MKLLLVITMLMASTVFAKVKSEVVEYKEGDNALEGVRYYDTSILAKKKKLPGIVIVHDWMGLGDNVKMRGEQLAELGYVAFVADIYGKGVHPKDAKEAGSLAGKFKAGDRKDLRARATAAFNVLADDKRVDANKISAMGYCFGGTTALEMARIGLPLTGVVSFHGGLTSVKPDDAKNIKAKLLVLHGAIDPNVPPAEVAQFEKELNDAKVNYEFVAYSGAVHAFTIKDAGNDISKGAAYNEQADKRSFVAMKNFLEEVNK